MKDDLLCLTVGWRFRMSLWWTDALCVSDVCRLWPGGIDLDSSEAVLALEFLRCCSEVREQQPELLLLCCNM